VKIKAIPTVYRGTRFASTLEADWACTFDYFGWSWRYEPVAVRLEDGQAYRPDFWLGAQRVWAEVKGPHNERIDKPAVLQKTVPGDAFDWHSDLVVVLRPPGPGATSETCQWDNATEGQDIVMVRCPDCLHYGFMDFAGNWSCRRHIEKKPEPNKFWTADGGALYRSGDLPFVRAPRDRPAMQQTVHFMQDFMKDFKSGEVK
jgi:hypothetical protein